jgi:PAS domain S-box-containing protein
MVLPSSVLTTERNGCRMGREMERDGTEHEEGLFRALFEHMEEGVALHDVIYDDSGNPIEYRIIDINPAYTLHTGASRALVVGKTSFEAYGVTPPPYLEEFMVAGHLGRFNRFETYFSPMDRYFSISVAPMGKGHFATIFTDITEQKHHEQLREQSERQFIQVFDLAPNPIAVTELDGTLINFNRAFCEVLGWKREDLVGRKTVELGIWPSPEQRQRAVERLKTTERFNGLVFDIRTNSGEIRQLELGGALIELGNRKVLVTAARDITEMLATERARREASEELERYFSLALDLMCIANVDGRFVRLNPAWEGVLGYSVAELKEANFLDFVHPEDLHETLQALKQLNDRQSVIAFTNRYRHRDGHWRYIEWRTIPYANGVVYAAARDVTDRVAATQALRRGLFDLERSQMVAHLGSYRFNVPDGTWECSRGLEKVFGINAEFPKTVEGWAMIIHPDDSEEMLRYLREDVIGKLGEFDREYRIVRSNDHATRWVHGLGSLELDEQGQPVTMFGTIQDVTERHDAEVDRLKLEEKLLQAQKLESLGVLAGGIAHDFNNLLTSILGNASLALDELSTLSPVRQQLTDIEVASKRAADLCRQLLAYSGKGRFVVQPLSLNELVEEMAHLLSVTISKKVVIKYNFSETIPQVLADATQIRQVVMNLITNASEALGEKSGVVAVNTGVMHCDAAYLKGTYLGENLREGKYSYIEVTDTGCGMDVETLTRVFDPFFTTKFTGRGLGLAAVLGIVRGHSGAIKVYTELKQGTSFKVLLPAVDGKIAVSAIDAVSKELKGSGLVLVVDDEETVRSVARSILERAGYSVVEATDGQDAVQKFLAQKDKVRVVVLDLTMPHLDGDACFREMRRIREDVRVLMTSGYNEQDVVSRFTGKGLAGFLQKPFTQHQLLTAITTILESNV